MKAHTVVGGRGASACYVTQPEGMELENQDEANKWEAEKYEKKKRQYEYTFLVASGGVIGPCLDTRGESALQQAPHPTIPWA